MQLHFIFEVFMQFTFEASYKSSSGSFINDSFVAFLFENLKLHTTFHENERSFKKVLLKALFKLFQSFLARSFSIRLLLSV